eukprot:scaffold2623_cov250-Pinguiococcus_pyrenoidosus.AAC.9
MGHLFSSRGPAQDVVIDFDSVLKDVSNVANEDRQLFEEIGACLGDAEAALEQLINYEDRANMIRRAISTPSDSQLQMQAFEDVFPNVIYIKRVHELTERIAVLLKDACARIVRDGDEAFEQKSGLVARVRVLLARLLRRCAFHVRSPLASVPLPSGPLRCGLPSRGLAG